MKIISNCRKFEALVSEHLVMWKELPIDIIEYGMDTLSSATAIYVSLDNIEELSQFFHESIRIPHNKKMIVAFKNNGRTTLLDFTSIYYIEAIGRDVHAYTENDGFQLKQRLYEFEPFPGYCRVNKSTIVNIRLVDSIIPYISGKLLLTLKDQQEIEVSRSYVKEFKNMITKG
ncbi:LytTR family transcriptional regulator [Vagococcus sp. BWB3-3]|uniref:LytTR family transcriptional regulator n=1 Tax=Vagococcus allomyrinae TaxID=2794353 RepID=A0A940SU88_9ENTE|nr:LytTR family DNA-binding domain-containing protein [Vagococcus allomyrinae]MBP1041070.1 LytTR family transcriptional regulator [Vagococcus allomyrinae]